MRLIDGDELIEHVWRDRVDSRERIANLVESMPTIKAVPATGIAPMVRCDDCVYYGSRRWCELHSSVFDDNAFCSYGERREE